MKKLREFLFRLRALFRRNKLDAEMREEMEHHLQLAAAEEIKEGETSAEARYTAQRKFGSVEQIKERAHDQRGFVWLDHLLQDLRFTLRSFRRNPGFVATAVLTLALGVGASTALFSVVHAVLIQALPYRDADRLVSLGGWLRNKTTDAGVTPADFNDYREQSGSFAQLAASISDGVPMNLSGGGEPERIKGALVTANFMETLGVPAALGRTFMAEDGRDGRDRLVLLSHGFWTRRFGAEPELIGRTVLIDGGEADVIGVMPPGFEYPAGADAWMPISLTPPTKLPASSRELHFLRPIGRLKPDVSLAQAQAELDGIARRIEGLYPKTNRDWSVHLVPLRERLVGSLRPTLRLMFAAVACVLLLACVNVASLLLARAAARQRELGVRAALGAGRARVVRQLLTENLTLALLGGAGGMLLAFWSLPLLVRFSAAFIPRTAEVTLNWPVLGFATLLALATGLLFGLFPAWDATRVDLTTALTDGGRGMSGGPRRQRVLRFLAGGEVAISAVLLVAGALLLQSLLRLQNVSPGFDGTNVLTLRIDLPNPYSEPEKKTAFFNQLQQRLGAIPGVESVGMVSELPVAGQSADAAFTIEGRTDAANAGVADLRSTNHAYFRALRVPLLRGRGFTAAEAQAAIKIAIVSEAFAQRYFPGEDPIGQRVRVNIFGPDAYEIVGVVGDVRHRGLNHDVRPTFYYPSLGLGYTNVLVRTAQEPTMIAAAARGEVATLNPHLPVGRVKTMEQWLHDSVAQPRFRSWLIGSFSLAALIIAVVGLYGVMAYSVAQRTNEFGVRMALGAGRNDLLRMVLKQGMRITLVGVSIGLAAAAAGGSVLSVLLFGVPAIHIGTFAAVATLLIGVGLCACYIPARRAAKVDPMIALRAE